jgi:hypothetical protein
MIKYFTASSLLLFPFLLHLNDLKADPSKEQLKCIDLSVRHLCSQEKAIDNSKIMNPPGSLNQVNELEITCTDPCDTKLVIKTQLRFQTDVFENGNFLEIPKGSYFLEKSIRGDLTVKGISIFDSKSVDPQRQKNLDEMTEEKKKTQALGEQQTRGASIFETIENVRHVLGALRGLRPQEQALAGALAKQLEHFNNIFRYGHSQLAPDAPTDSDTAMVFALCRTSPN